MLVYFYVDGIDSSIKQDDPLCSLLIISVTKHGGKELVTLKDCYQESEVNLA